MQHIELDYADPVHEGFFDAIQELVGAASPNFRVEVENETTLKLLAGTGDDQKSIAIKGRYRWRTTGTTAALPASTPNGEHPVYVTASDNNFGGTVFDPDAATDYSFGLQIKKSGELPATALYRLVGYVTVASQKITAFRQVVNSTSGAQIENGALSSSGDITWTREQNGAWVPQLKANSVEANELADNSVDTNALINLAVTEAKVAALAITEGKLAANSVGTAKIVDLAVETAKLAALAVTEGKIGNEAVGTGKIVNLAVTAAKLAAEAVETGKIANLAVTAAKLASSAVTASKIGVLPGCRVSRESAQTIAKETYTPIQFNGGERYDTDTMHSPTTNPDRITIKTAGVYLIQGFFTFAGNADGIRSAVITRNATGAALPPDGLAEHSEPGEEAPAAGAGGNAINITAVASFAVNDIIRLTVWHNAPGAGLNVMGGDAVHVAELAVQFLGA